MNIHISEGQKTPGGSDIPGGPYQVVRAGADAYGLRETSGKIFTMTNDLRTHVFNALCPADGSKISIGANQCNTESGNPIPAGDYIFTYINGHPILQVGGKGYAITPETAGILKKQNDEQTYLNGEYAAALNDRYREEFMHLKSDERDQHRYQSATLLIVGFQNRDGWPKLKKDGVTPLPSKLDVIAVAKQVEAFLISKGYSRDSILESYRKSKSK